MNMVVSKLILLFFGLSDLASFAWYTGGSSKQIGFVVFMLAISEIFLGIIPRKYIGNIRVLMIIFCFVGLIASGRLIIDILTAHKEINYFAFGVRSIAIIIFLYIGYKIKIKKATA